ncbi:phosphoribosylaminoimidazolesuccinocarboxamide synthase [candidate division WOR-3 bacterium]|uniref:Phosphoribosylaminoimidazole-succinocarboxamide synthase n=1 Tax=candidate division WOR-3 bacterium TaxID=2052148 RepID=A0A9D5KA60_UNCW3|nr:phosphoribosylaminoimidazolesuccinocarboxamide synthase [candidate division WOR-3 bacterium]MBD3364910.1 phosphoribosylaminoimidazolesuccinocarboxamide synthase [candidate division WOR-3 bacterium]
MDKLIEGKTKIIYDMGDGTVKMVSKDDITSGDGDQHDVIKGKASFANRTTANVFELLNRKGVPTHYLGRIDDYALKCKRCEMIPLEIVVRGTATGSYLKRNPLAEEGMDFDPRPVEFFIKDDSRHDPIVTFGKERWHLHPAKEPVSDKNVIEDIEPMLTKKEIEFCESTGREVFDILFEAWAAQDVKLIDLKIEFGRSDEGKLVVADVIDNDSWRIWPGGDKDNQLDKQVYRDTRDLDGTRSRYAMVAEMTDKFLSD